MSKNKIYICTPCYDAMMTMQYAISLINLISILNKRNIEFLIDFIGNESLITRARNNALGKFMKTDFTHLLFIDSDIEFQENAFFDLLDLDKDVTCCVYAKKSFNWNKFIHSMKTDKSYESLESRGLDYNYNLHSNEDVNNSKYKRVRHASTGFMLIKRDIINRLIENYSELKILTDNLSKKDDYIYGLFCCMIKDSIYLSEDYSFCERVNNIGGEVWISLNHNLNHIGKYVFRSDIKNRTSYIRTQNERCFYE